MSRNKGDVTVTLSADSHEGASEGLGPTQSSPVLASITEVHSCISCSISCQTSHPHIDPALLKLVSPCAHMLRLTCPTPQSSAPMLPRVQEQQGPHLEEVAPVGPQGCRLRGHHSCAR